MEYMIQACADRGIIKQNNQDSFMVRAANTSSGRALLAVLCDGMGGLEQGEIASGSVVYEFDRWMREDYPVLSGRLWTDGELRHSWERCIRLINEKIRLYGKQNGIQLGTTLTALLLTDRRYAVVQVGDSRAYELGKKIRQITEDQSLVQQEVREGRLSPRQARTDERRNVLLQCVGVMDQIHPVFSFGTPLKNAVYLLCSDGFCHELTTEEMKKELCPEKMKTEQKMRTQMEYLIEQCKCRGERDNISLVAIRTIPDGEN